MRLVIAFLMLLVHPLCIEAQSQGKTTDSAGLSSSGPVVGGGKRVALVIGNSKYKNTPSLVNPGHDAADMAAVLKNLGFTVLEGRNLDKARMDRTIRDFANTLNGAKVGLFFYAGHGLQVGGQNYLVPTDAQLTTSAALDFEMVRLDLVHRTMERESATNIIILDACRDNPLARNLARALGTRSTQIGRGLAAVESGQGTLISYSTQPGNVALDGTGRNSPFAAALIRHISKPGEDLPSILINVRNDVMKATDGRQVPWEHSALTAKFYFASPKPSAPAPETPADVAPSFGLPSSGAEFTREDVLRSMSLAQSRGITTILPFMLIRPPNKVAAEFRQFVGVWLSDAGVAGSRRQLMVIITSADEAGNASGIIAFGPGMPGSFIPNSPTFHSNFTGRISGNVLTFQHRGINVRGEMNGDTIKYVESSGFGKAFALLSPVWRFSD